jgi:hypothetical protein
MKDKPAQDHRADGMELKLEGSHDAKVAAAASKPPEEVFVLLGAGVKEMTVCGDNICRDEVVAAESVLTHEPSEPTAQSKARDSSVGDCATWSGETEKLSLAVEFSPGYTALDVGDLARGIDPDALHLRQVNYDAAIAGAVPGGVMGAAPYRSQDLVRPGKVHGCHHVSNTGTTRN